MRGGRRVISAVILAGGALLWASPASAQGNGNGHARGLSKGRGPTPSAAAGPTGARGIPVVGIRQFGSWLDDASLPEPGGGWAAASLGLVQSAGGRQMDFPIADVGLGLTPRVQVGLTVPLYRLTLTDGTQAAGLGDVYLSARMAAVQSGQDNERLRHGRHSAGRDPERPGSGWRAELPSGDPGQRRMASTEVWHLQISGWFSRGSFFGSGAVEVPLNQRVIVTGVLSHTRALNDDPNADVLGLSRAQTRMSREERHSLRPRPSRCTAASAERISTQDANAASLMLSGGVSVSLARTPTGRR